MSANLSPPSPAPPGLGGLRAEELLLAVIVGLGSARLIGVIVPAFFVAPGEIVVESDLRVLLVSLVLGLQACGRVGAVWWVALRRNGLAWGDLGLVAIPAGWIGRAVGAAVLAFLLAGAVNLAVQSLMEAPQRNPQIDVIAPAGFSWGALIAMLALVGVVAPLAEEILFRGLVYGWLRERIGIGLATVLSALVFALLHDIPWLVPAIALLGIILAQVYERSGSIWAAGLTHGLFNAASTLIYYIALAQGYEL